MNELQKAIITQLVYTFTQKVDNVNQNEIIEELCSMNISDSIDKILVSLNDLLNRRIITQDAFFSIAGDIVKLSPEKYTCADDLIDRINWIKGMNMEHPKMPLTENHQLVMDAFDQFSNLLQGKFDCYYNGGLMVYLATNHPLERYRSDLDLYINEQQLAILKISGV